MYKRSAHVLFLGTGDSCQSQMAAGWANHLGGGWIVARSTVIGPHGTNSCAVTVMGEAGIDISRQPSSCLAPGMLTWADLVVTVCRGADEQCPALPAGVQKRHWPLANPSQGGGNEAGVLQSWRMLRDDIRNRVEGMIGGMKMLERMDTD